MKEQTLNAIAIETLPQSLRGLVEILPQATWNGYNVWANFTDEDEAKSLGFALSKKGKHAGQYFTNEKLQKSLAKKRAKAAEEKKSLTPPPVEAPAPVAKSPEVVEAQAHLFDERTEFCAVIEFDVEGHDVHNINLFRVSGCTPEIFKREYLDRVERRNKTLTITNVRVLPKLYKSDASFKGAFRNMKEYKGKDFLKCVEHFDYSKFLQRINRKKAA